MCERIDILVIVLQTLVAEAAQERQHLKKGKQKAW